MICKELDPFTATAPSARSGRRAEEQMAFYLRRAFERAPDVRVLNGIRLERGGDAAQMDHLILHRWGAVIVESKSVTSQVEVNDREEWARLWNGRPRGMPSPVLQAQRQGLFLRRYLDEHAEALLGKFLGLLQAHFGNVPMDVLVAVSDDGLIRQPRKNPQELVCKADQVPDRVRSLVDGYRKGFSPFGLTPKGGYQWTEREIERISAFLLEHHRPLAQGAPTPDAEAVDLPFPDASAHHAPPVPRGAAAPATVPPRPAPRNPTAPGNRSPTAPEKQCRACLGRNVAIEYGRYGYYLKCADCGGNTPIKALCGGCGERARLRKSGREFYADCSQCGRSDLYFLNGTEDVADGGGSRDDRPQP